MNIIFTYLFESGICLTVFYLIFYLLLRKDTIFPVIRFYLIGAVLISLIIPLLNFHISTSSQAIQSLKTKPIQAIQSVIYTPTIRLATEDKIALKTNQEFVPLSSGDRPDGTERIHLLDFLTGIYFLGLSITLFLFIKNLSFVFKLIQTKSVQKLKMKGYSIVETEGLTSPYSFLKYIFISNRGYSEEDYLKLICHERTHVYQLHTLDILLVELIAILHWFNPIIYLYKRSIRETHEYIADRKVIASGYDPINYQELLVRETLKKQSIRIANAFNSSLIKRRLMMMKNTPTNKAVIKLIGILPVLMLLVFYFSVGLTTKSFSESVRSFVEDNSRKNYDEHWWSLIAQQLAIDTTRTRHTPDDSLIVAFCDYSKINSDKSIVSDATMLVKESNKIITVIESPLIFHFRDEAVIHAFDAEVKRYDFAKGDFTLADSWYGEKVVIKNKSGGRMSVEPFPYSEGESKSIKLRGNELKATGSDQKVNFILPVKQGRLAAGFGNRLHPIFKKERLHTGIDIAAPKGTAVFAAADGVVEAAGIHGGYGNHVVIRHLNGYRSSYAHLNNIAVQWGQHVKRGDLIGAIGKTGIAITYHLHFEIRKNEVPLDPEDYINLSQLINFDTTNVSLKEHTQKSVDNIINIFVSADTLITVNGEIVKIKDLKSKFIELGMDKTSVLSFGADSLTHMDMIYKIEKIQKEALSHSQ